MAARWIGAALGLLVGVIAAGAFLGGMDVFTGAIGGGVGGAMGGAAGEAVDRFLRRRRGLPPRPGPDLAAVQALPSAGELRPLAPARRFWSRVGTNLIVTVLIYLTMAISPKDPDLIAVVSIGILAAAYLYYLTFYCLVGGHIGHLMVGGQVRDASTGRRLALWQAAVRATYELAIVALGFLFLIGYGSWLTLQGMAVDNATVAVAERVANLLAALFVAVPMGIMVLARPADRRHAFDLLSRSIVVEKTAEPETIHRAAQAEAAERAARDNAAGRF